MSDNPLLGKLYELKGKHEGEEIVCVGSGPSLMNIPPSFLMQRTNIGVNFLPWWMPFLELDYWIGLDSVPLENLRVPRLRGVPKLVATRQKEYVEKQGYPLDDVVWFEMEEKIKGMPFRKGGGGIAYSTSLASAAHAADWMGAQTILLVGFDCTVGERNKDGVGGVGPVTGPGITRVPHFFDKAKAHGYKKKWEDQMLSLYAHFYKKGVRMVNLSRPTAARRLPNEDWRDYWIEPDKYHPEAIMGPMG